MRIFWMWLIWSIGGVIDLTMITWNLPVKQGRRYLELFYGISIPLIAVWKLYLAFQGKSTDMILLILMAGLIMGTWRITEEGLGGVLTAFAFLYIGGVGSELVAVGIIYSLLGIPVVPLEKAEGSMLCMMTANVLVLFYLMLVNRLWKRYGKGKEVKRIFLLFFFVLVQTVFLFWIVYAGYQEIIPITVTLLIGAGIIIFGTMSFSFAQMYDEETRKTEEKLKKLELEIQKEDERYRKLEEKEKILHHIRHDFNNHLAAVYYLSKEGKTKQAEKLLEEMELALRNEGNEGEYAVETGKENRTFCLEEESSILQIPGRRIFLLPAGQFLLFPSMIQILTAHWGNWNLFLDGGILFFMTAVDGLWLLILLNQGKREKRNKQLLADICRQQVELDRENVIQEGIQERKALKEELLSYLKKARAAVEDSKEPFAFRSYLLNEQKKEKQRYCDNELVNSVLEEKHKECQNLHISFSVKVEIPEGMEIKSSHLCSIFTNLLDNGIRACQSLSEDQRWIVIQSKKQGDYLYLRVSNATSEEYMKRPVRPGHGLGRQIIARLAETYQGESWAEVSGETYIAAVVLQICGISNITSNEGN